MKRELITALDFPTWKETEAFLHQFDRPLFVKVGMELYLQNGPFIIEELKKKEHRIFLDLKLHDIPNTVKRAMRGLASLGIDLINVHAAGGKHMMEAALEGLTEGVIKGYDRPKLIAVTQLTSTSEEQMKREQNIVSSLEESVLHYALLAKSAGLDGVVCSSQEVPSIQQKCGEDFLTVTPGIRLASDDAHDQARIVTPKKAKQLGASSIVVGRSITQANNPVEAYEKILTEWESVS
ncbi:orotidine-5'-phosphate decarboxylase [Bacillus spongiae]|uniref:Orotidine 5'-phosphate decarboxylase n=1 Tax=Bacillus spongiae TaxID=2683610 RepID=A0ABU8H9W3_9BACI